MQHLRSPHPSPRDPAAVPARVRVRVRVRVRFGFGLRCDLFGATADLDLNGRASLDLRASWRVLFDDEVGILDLVRCFLEAQTDDVGDHDLITGQQGEHERDQGQRADAEGDPEPG